MEHQPSLDLDRLADFASLVLEAVDVKVRERSVLFDQLNSETPKVDLCLGAPVQDSDSIEVTSEQLDDLLQWRIF